MALETGNFISDLVITNPTSTDDISEGDDHLRFIKKAITQTYPGMDGRVNRSSTKSEGYTVLLNDNTTLFNATADLTLSLTAASTLGNGFTFAVHANGGDVTIDPSGSETINGSTTIIIPDGSTDVIYCNGTSFVAVLNGGITVSSLNSGQLAGMRNRIINGDMRIDQRNAGAEVDPSLTGTYMVDRFQIQLSQTSKVKHQQNAAAVTLPEGFANYLGITSLSAYTVLDADFFQVKHLVEGHNIYDIDFGKSTAKDITLSFKVRSSLTGSFGFVLAWGSSVGNERSYPILYTISAANTWEKITIIIPGDTTASAGGLDVDIGIGFNMRWSLGGGSTNAGTSGTWVTANIQTVTGDTSVVGTSGATFYITGVQLELDGVSTPFEHRSIGVELGLCERYHEIGGPGLSGAALDTSTIAMSWQFKTPKRADPTITLTTTSPIVTEVATAIRTGSSSALVSTAITKNGAYVEVNGFATNLTQLRAIVGRNSDYVAATSEL